VLEAPTKSVDDRFGSSVAISDDGATVVVGGSGGSSKEGFACVYKYKGSAWDTGTPLPKTVGSTTDMFGTSVAISADGNLVVAGSPAASASTPGRAFFYKYSAGTWNEVKALDSSGTPGNDFGRALAMSKDGQYVFVGANYATENGQSSSGAVYVYGWNGDSTCTLLKTIQPSDVKASEVFGWSVWLSGDGDYLAAGSIGRSVTGVANAGAVYLFRNDSGSWTEIRRYLNPHPVDGDQFGVGVCVSNAASVMAIGAAGRDLDGGINRGVVFVY
jgi:WD40 repeat protein